MEAVRKYKIILDSDGKEVNIISLLVDVEIFPSLNQQLYFDSFNAAKQAVMEHVSESITKLQYTLEHLDYLTEDQIQELG